MDAFGKGWKMVVGVLILGVGQALGQLHVLTPDQVSILLIIGSTLTGVGVAHKAERAVTALETPADADAPIADPARRPS